MSGRLTAAAGHRLAIPASVGVLGLVLIGIGQVVPNRHTIEDDLTSRSTAALESADLVGLSVSFSGRDATITGPADAALAEKAEDVVGAVNGVRVAKADLTSADATQADAAVPTEVSAVTDTPAPAETSSTAETLAPVPVLPVGFTFAEGTITVTGTVDSAAAGSELVNAVKASGNGWMVVDRLQVSGSLPAPAEPEQDRLTAVTQLVARAPIDGTKLVIQYSRGSVIMRGTLPDFDTELALLTAAAATVDDKSKVVDGLDTPGAG